MKTIKLLAVALMATSLTACATVSRLAATDVSIVEAALFVNTVSAAELNLSDFEDRLVIYASVDTVAKLRRGEITEDEARSRVLAIIEDRG